MTSVHEICGFNTKKECPKKMLNGPCGGVQNGLCEVSGTCVWIKIFAKLKADENLGEFIKVRLPKIK